jgi:hypothetical protein
MWLTQTLMFIGIANLITNDPATSIVYAESLVLAQDLVEFMFTGKIVK